MTLVISHREEVTVGSEGIRLSQIVWNRFKRPMPDVVELTLAENPGLAELGLHLPVGATFLLPVPVPTLVKYREPIRLWD